MGKKFLASVAEIELFEKRNDRLVHFASMTTLTDTVASFSNTMEEVRGGRGGKLYGRFSHSSGISLQLTNVMFEMRYMSALFGFEAMRGSASNLFNSASVTFSNHIGHKNDGDPDPCEIGYLCGSGIVAWANNTGCRSSADPIYPLKYVDGKFIAPSKMPDGTYCVKYYVEKDNCEIAKINAAFRPREYFARMKIQEFSADNTSSRSAVGYLIFNFPRFQLDGNLDLSLSMTSNAPISMNGTILAVQSGGCSGGQYYGEMFDIPVEQGTEKDFRDGLVSVVIDRDYIQVGDVPHIWGYYSSGQIKLLDNQKIAKQTNKNGDVFNGFKSDNGNTMLLDNGKWSSRQNPAYVVICSKNTPVPIPSRRPPYYTDDTPGVLCVDTCAIEGVYEEFVTNDDLIFVTNDDAKFEVLQL